MNRLVHDRKALFRSMQMSQSDVFLFVEGIRNDRFFYSEICKRPISDANCRYQLVLARELPGGVGGKVSLIKFFKFVRRRRGLVEEFQGKRTACIFFLDKDVDEFCRNKVSSDHVIYTKFYDVENHLFVAGDLIIAGAASASLDKNLVADKLGSPEDWRRRCGQAWKEWVKLCLFVRRKGVNFGSNYGVASRVNAQLYGPLDIALYSQFKSNLEAASGLNSTQFKRAFNRYARKVEAHYHADEHDIVFKGKWYSGFLAYELQRIAPGGHLDVDSLGKKFLPALAVTIDFGAAWTEHFRIPIRRILARVRA